MFGMRSGASTSGRRARKAGILPWTALAGLVLLVVVIGTTLLLGGGAVYAGRLDFRSR
jgi:hypothetical protein